MADEVLNEKLAADVEVMLADGFIEGLVLQLRAKFRSVAAEADAAVGHAVHMLIIRCTPPTRPRDYLAASAYNEMKKYAVRAARTESIDRLSDDDDRRDEVPAAGWTVEERALIDDVYRQVCAEVETWETGNVRAVTLLYLEAAYLGEPLPSDEAAEILAEQLGEDIDPDFVRVWKSRGFKRLRTWIENQGDTDDR